MEIPISIDKGIVLVDTSYYMFNRYFSSLKWYKISKQSDVSIQELHNDIVFVTAFKKHILADVMKFAMFPYLDRPFSPKLPQRHKRFRNTVMFCLDCKRCDIWRMAIYPEYKASRKQLTDLNVNMVGIFYDYLEYLLNNAITNEHGQLDIVKLSLPQLEADDVVYLTLKQLRSSHPTYIHPVLVITNDNDFLQMTPINAIVTNMQGLQLTQRMAADDTKTSTMLKVLLGDVSDNIKGVPCVSTQSALTLAKMKEKQRQEWIVEHTKGSGIHSCIKVYKSNKKLILLRHIPKHLAQSFNDKYKLVAAKDIKTY